MSGGVPSSATSPEIFEAIKMVVTPSELLELKDRLTKYHDPICDILDTVAPEAVHYVRNHDKDVHTSPALGVYIAMVRSVVKTALLYPKKRKNQPLSVDAIVDSLQKSLDRNFISKESLELILKYFEGFCAKYPPQKISPGDGNMGDAPETDKPRRYHEAILLF